MKKIIYIIWNTKENRPVINSISYGSCLFYLTIEQAQAYIAASENSFFEIKKVEIEL